MPNLSVTRKYYIAEPSHWPIMGSAGLFFLGIGVINIIHGNWYGHYYFMAGALLLAYMMFGWFRNVVDESLAGLYSKQMDRTYRWGMGWFIFSEVAFFGIFFGALCYVRLFVLPQLAGTAGSMTTHDILWPEFKAAWPLLINPNPKVFTGPKEVIGAFGIPAINTLILLMSAVTVTWAHWGLLKKKSWQVNSGLLLTILLGITFLGMQAYEYHHAYSALGLTLGSGIYGSTFFMLTGFHGAHVTVGLIMLIVMLIRSLKGHFKPEHHFAFEAAAWYWHFVDVVWLFLFVFVYWV